MRKILKGTRTILVTPCVLCILTASGFAGIGQMLIHFAAQAGAMNIPESPDRPTLDPVSESCLRCHDEISVSGRDATDISIPSHTGPNGGGPSHPVGILYELSQSTSRTGFFPFPC